MLELNVEVNVDELVAKAQKNLEQWLKEKNDEFLSKLMEVGREVAQREFGSAAAVSIEKEADGYVLYARGEAVCFIEFGTGVYADPNDPLAGYMPFDVKPGSWSESEHGAGTWGRWLAEGKDPDKYPFNRRPKYGMWNAYKTMEREVPRIAKEVYR